MLKLTDDQKKLFTEKAFAHVATTNPDGSPQVTPVWVEMIGDHIVFNSEKKRKKIANLERDPRVAISILDPANPYHYLEVRGHVVEITTDGANEGIDRLAKKYMDKDRYPFHKDGDVRVVIRIEPDKVLGM